MSVIGAASLDLLAVNPGLVIWTVITFLVVLTILWIFAWRPITNAIDARNARVEDDLNKSRRLREEAEALLRDYEQKLERAKTEALEIIEEGEKDADVARAKMMCEAEDETNRIKQNMQKEIEQAKLQALEELQNMVVDLSVDIIGGILKNHISVADHKELAKRELASFKKSKN